MSELVASTSEGGGAKEVDALATSFEVSAEVSGGAITDLPEAVKIGTTITNLRSGVMFHDEKLGMNEEQWSKIKPEVKRRLKLICHHGAIRRLKNEEMFLIQANSIPIMCMDNPNGKAINLVAQAPGGAGKTVAFCIGLLSRIDTKLNHTQGIIIGMTRELARMIYHDALVPLGAFLGYDDEGKEQINPPLSARLVLPDDAGFIKQDPYSEHVIVGTPGKLKAAMNMYDRANKRYANDRQISVDKLRVLVLDEADEVCLGEGYQDDVRIIRGSVPKSCQIFLYSATYPENVIEFTKKFLSPPIMRIELEDKTDLMIKNRQQYYMQNLLHETVAKVNGIFQGKTFTVTKVIEGTVEMGNEIKVGNELIRITKQDEGTMKYHTYTCCRGCKQASIITSGGGRGGGRGRGRGGGRGGRGRGDPISSHTAVDTCADCKDTEKTYDIVRGKVGLLREIYQCLDSNQSIVFCNTIDSVNAAHSLLESFGLESSILHGKLEFLKDRDRAIDNFRGFDLQPGKKPSKVLICTDVLARGVDIPNVNLVVNFDIPQNYDNRSKTHYPAMETYAHRIARCARAGRYGVVINFVHTNQDVDFMTQIARHWCPSDTSPDKLIPQWTTFTDESGEQFDGDMDGFQKWFVKFQQN